MSKTRNRKNYGPSLTPSMERDLKAEIASFNEKKTRAAIENGSVGRPDVDAYGNWLAKHEGKETVRANPDLLSEEDTIPWGRATTDPDIKNAMKQLPQILSARQMQVWRYVMRDGLSTVETAEKLHITHQNVSNYLKAAKEKVMKHFNG